MNKKEMQKFREILQKKKETLLKELGYMEKKVLFTSQKDSAGDLSGYSFHMADQATDSMDREQNFMFASREGKYLNRIDEALERIEKGTYGKCYKCGGSIPKVRLEAVPTATSCVACKTKEKNPPEQ